MLHAFLKTRREKFLASRETETDHDTGEILGRISTLVDEKLTPFKGRNQIVQGGDLSKEEIVGGIKMVYRDAVTKGYKPSVKVLDMMLECMCTNFYLERIQKVSQTFPSRHFPLHCADQIPTPSSVPPPRFPSTPSRTTPRSSTSRTAQAFSPPRPLRSSRRPPTWAFCPPASARATWRSRSTSGSSPPSSRRSVYSCYSGP